MNTYKYGDIGPNGKRFKSYYNRRNKKLESWFSSEDVYLRDKESKSLAAASYRETNRESIRQKQRDNYGRYKSNEISNRENRILTDPEEEQRRKNRRVQKQKEWIINQGIPYQIKCMLKSANLRAKKNNIPFDLTEGDILIPEVCPILGIPIFFNTGGGRVCDNSISLDRVDNSKGYTKDNIRIISYRANALKNDGTLDELEKIVDYMKKNLP